MVMKACAYEEWPLCYEGPIVETPYKLTISISEAFSPSRPHVNRLIMDTVNAMKAR